MRAIFRRDLVFVIANQILLSIGSALIVILLARFTDQVTFGEIRYLIAMLAILAFWSLPGISTIINHQASEMTRNDLFDLISVQFRWGLGAMGGALALAFFHILTDQHELAQAFVIGGILAPIANLYLVPGLVLAGVHNFKLKTLVDTGIIVAIVAGALIGALFFETVAGILVAYLGLQAAATTLALCVIYYILPKKRKGWIPKKEVNHLTEGRQLTYLQIPFSLIPAIEKAVIFLILGPLSLAVFVIAVLPVEHFKTAFRNLLQFYMLPHLKKHDVNLLLHWFATGALLLTLGVIALVLFIAYGMPLLFENFDTAKRYAFLLILAVLPLPIHVITVNWIAKRQMKTLKFYAFLAVFTNIVLIAFSAYLFGLLGAIIAKIVYEVFLAAGLLHLDKHKTSSIA